MKRVFLDTNVLIDYLAHREPFFEEAAIIVSLAKHNKDKVVCRLHVFCRSKLHS